MSEPNRIFWPPRNGGKPGKGIEADPAAVAAGRACDHPGCQGNGEFRAPKSRDHLNDYFWFCLDHVRAYNAAWDYYAGLSADEIESMLRKDVTWQRPTWPLGQRGGGFRFDAAKIKDGFGLFGDGFETKPAAPQAGTAELSAMREMELSGPLTVELVRARYRELCKLHHPDTNGGDKEAEERFKRIGQAYKTLMESLI